VLIVIGSTPRHWPGSSPRWRRCSQCSTPRPWREALARIVAALAVLFATGSTPRRGPDRRRSGGADRHRLDAEALARIVAGLAVLIAGRSTPRPWPGSSRSGG
jgi:hypothetical protein